MANPSMPYPDFVALVSKRAKQEGLELTMGQIAELARRAGYETMTAPLPRRPGIQAAPEREAMGPRDIVEEMAPTSPRANYPRAEQYLRDPKPGMIERYAPDALEMIGGLAGASIGKSPQAAMGGAATGRMGGRAIESLARGQRYGMTPLETITRGADSPGAVASGIQSAAKEATGAALFETVPVAGAYAPSLLRAGFYRAVGARSPAALQKAYQAQMHGVPLGVTDISDHAIVQGLPRIFGAFPVIGGPIQRHAIGQAEAITKGLRRFPQAVTGAPDDRFWIRLGPVMGMSQSSRNVFKSGKAAFGVLKDETNKRYADAYELARQHKTSIPTAQGKLQAHETLQILIDQQPPLAKKVGGRTVKRRPSGQTALARKFANDYTELVDNLTIEQFDRMSADLDNYMSAAKRAGRKEEFRYLAQMKSAMEADFAHMKAPPEVLQAFNAADEFKHESLKLFESSIGQKFGTVDKRVFKIGFEESGTLTPDQLHKVVLRDGSKDAVDELRAIVLSDPVNGRKAWRDLIGSHLDDKIEGAIKTTVKAGPEKAPVEVVNYDRLRAAIGLSNTKSPEYEALTAMLKGTGVRPRDIESFIRSAERAFPQGLPNVAELARRRTVLGGMKSGAKTMLPFAQRHASKAAATAGGLHAATSLPTAIVMSLALRHLGKVLTSPKGLRAVIELSKPGISDAQSRAALRRLQIAIPTVFAAEALGEAGVTAAADMAAPVVDRVKRGASYATDPWGIIRE